MTELKPVAHIHKGSLLVFEEGLHDRQIVASKPCPEQGLTLPLYAIPDTHRVVRADALEDVLQMAGLVVTGTAFGSKERKSFSEICDQSRAINNKDQS